MKPSHPDAPAPAIALLSLRSSLLFSFLLGLFFCLMSGASFAQTEPFGVGDQIPEISLLDQHEQPQTIDLSTRIILFSRDMDGGKLLKEAFDEAPAATLSERQAAYVADISGMPSLIARMFALPSMRKRPYPMLLDRTGDATQRLPDVEGQATVIFLDALEIQRIEHAESGEEVRTLLGLEALSSERASE